MFDAVNFTAEQQTLLASIPDPMFRQTTRDFCVNQQFRKDYWVKGAEPSQRWSRPSLQASASSLAQPRADVGLSDW